MKQKMLFLLPMVLVLLASAQLPNGVNEEKECTVYVKWYSQSGSPAEGKKVVGYTSNRTLSTEGTQVAYTGPDGKVVLEWDSYKSLCCIYVAGERHDGNFEDGGVYTFVGE